MVSKRYSLSTSTEPARDTRSLRHTQRPKWTKAFTREGREPKRSRSGRSDVRRQSVTHPAGHRLSPRSKKEKDHPPNPGRQSSSSYVVCLRGVVCREYSGPPDPRFSRPLPLSGAARRALAMALDEAKLGDKLNAIKNQQVNHFICYLT